MKRKRKRRKRQELTRVEPVDARVPGENGCEVGGRVVHADGVLLDITRIHDAIRVRLHAIADALLAQVIHGPARRLIRAAALRAQQRRRHAVQEAPRDDAEVEERAVRGQGGAVGAKRDVAGHHGADNLVHGRAVDEGDGADDGVGARVGGEAAPGLARADVDDDDAVVAFEGRVGDLCGERLLGCVG